MRAAEGGGTIPRNTFVTVFGDTLNLRPVSLDKYKTTTFEKVSRGRKLGSENSVSTEGCFSV